MVADVKHCTSAKDMLPIGPLSKRDFSVSSFSSYIATPPDYESAALKGSLGSKLKKSNGFSSESRAG
jgi:hypothetical protein